jgi:hypothetical protein
MTDHYLLMTATPHKGDSENFCRFLSLLDRDVYGNIQSLQVARRTGTMAVRQDSNNDVVITEEEYVAQAGSLMK